MCIHQLLNVEILKELDLLMMNLDNKRNLSVASKLVGFLQADASTSVLQLVSISTQVLGWMVNLRLNTILLIEPNNSI